MLSTIGKRVWPAAILETSRRLTREDDLRALTALAERADGSSVGLLDPEGGLKVCSVFVLDWLIALERQAAA